MSGQRYSNDACNDCYGMATQIRYGEIAMMGEQTGLQPKIFYPHMNLEQRVPQTHLLRRIQEQIDFNFIYAEVRDAYGSNGNVSIPPPVILKMMLLLVLYNVRSERELMETIPMRLDWLWFLGYDIDSEVPDHSVLSKARHGGRMRRLGDFERIVWQCVEAGLVDGIRSLWIRAWWMRMHRIIL
jgi:transposase